MSVSNAEKLTIVDDPADSQEHVTRLHAVVTHYMRDEQNVRFFWRKKDAESFLWSIELGGNPSVTTIEMLGECIDNTIHEAQVLDESWDVMRSGGLFITYSFANLVLAGRRGYVQSRQIYRLTRWQRFQNLMKGLGWRLRQLVTRE